MFAIFPGIRLHESRLAVKDAVRMRPRATGKGRELAEYAQDPISELIQHLPEIVCKFWIVYGILRRVMDTGSGLKLDPKTFLIILVTHAAMMTRYG